MFLTRFLTVLTVYRKFEEPRDKALGIETASFFATLQLRSE